MIAIIKIRSLIMVAALLLVAPVVGCSGKGGEGKGEGEREKEKVENRKLVAPSAKAKGEGGSEKGGGEKGGGDKGGGDKGGGESDAARGQKMREEGLVSPNAPKAGDDVVAWSGELRITKESFETYVNRLPPSQRREFSSMEKKQELLRNLIRFEMLAHQADEAGMADDPEVRLAMKTEMVKRFLHQRFGEGTTVEVPEEELQAEYQKQYKRFNKPERVRASHIFIVDKAKAKEILAELKTALGQQGTNTRRVFREFVKKYSDDEATRKRGGDLLFFSRTGEREGEAPLDKAVVEAAFGMQNTDQISTLIRSDRGHHILLVTNRRKKVERTFQDVREELKANFVRGQLDERRKKFMESLVVFADWHFELPNLKQIQVEGAPDSKDVKARLESIKQGSKGE